MADTPGGYVTELKVLGDNALDVHLLLGEEDMKPGPVRRAGVDILAGRYAVVPGPRLPYGDVGPGVRVEKVRSTRPRPPSLQVTTAAYHMNASHDLLKQHRLFGLTAARDASRGHFPGISDSPLAIGSARQNTMAKFGALGFEAAAVTAFGVAAGGLLDLRYITTRINAAFDRPFGFLALHRHTRLVLAAGWVTDPLPFPSTTWRTSGERDEDAHRPCRQQTDGTLTTRASGGGAVEARPDDSRLSGVISGAAPCAGTAEYFHEDRRGIESRSP